MLRSYQQKYLESVLKERHKHNRIVLVAPTGSGKTILSSALISQFVSEGKRVLFVVDMIPLIDQSYAAFRRFDLKCGFIKAGYPENFRAPVQIASVQTLTSRHRWQDLHFDVIIYDECHVTSWYAIASKLRELYPSSLHLGLTATPYATSKKRKLGLIYSKLIWHVTPKELQDQGFLVPLSYYSVGEPDLKGIKTRNYDYDAESLAIVCDRDEVIDKAITQWVALASNRPTITFCINVTHAKHTLEKFSKIGVKAEIITGNVDNETRKQIYQRFRDRETTVLVSVDCLSKGFDEPCAEVGLMLRPSKSKNLVHQQIGRILRISPDTGKISGLLLDCAGNIKKHGFIEDVKGYKLLTVDSDYEDENPTPLKECPECGRLLYGFQMECECGYKFALKEKPIHSGELKQIFINKEEQKNYLLYRQLIKTAYEKGYKPGYSFTQFKQRTGQYPKFDWGLGAIFGFNSSEDDMRSYWDKLQNINVSEAKKAMTLEFGSQWKSVIEAPRVISKDTVLNSIEKAFLQSFLKTSVDIDIRQNTVVFTLKNKNFEGFLDRNLSSIKKSLEPLGCDLVVT